LFLERKRRRNLPYSLGDLKALRARMLRSLVPNLARVGFPYLKTPPRIDLGYGLALHNPLVHPQRIVFRAFRDALDLAAHERRAGHSVTREMLQDIIVRERIVPASQPIVLMRDRTVLGCEALSRGARGTGLEAPDPLFAAAENHDLLIELDRLCRAR